MLLFFHIKSHDINIIYRVGYIYAKEGQDKLGSIIPVIQQVNNDKNQMQEKLYPSYNNIPYALIA